MIQVPANCISHISNALELEIERQRAIEKRDEASWPTDFDLNDAPLYYMARDSLRGLSIGEDGQLDLSGKALWMTLNLLPDYVANNRGRITPEEYCALKHFYLEHHPWRSTVFPPPQ
jgi:hypothetical protein